MGSIFFGLIFALFSVKINFGICSVDILPNFVGFYLMIKGFKELYPVNSSIFEVFGYMKTAFVYSIFILAFDLFGIFAMMGIVAVFFKLIEAGLLIFIVYKFIDVLRKEERDNQIDLLTKKLEQVWNINTCCLVVSVVAGLVPNFPLLAIPISIVNIAVSAAFLYEFSKTKREYYNSYHT